jgi:hypothetical protein
MEQSRRIFAIAQLFSEHLLKILFAAGLIYVLYISMIDSGVPAKINPFDSKFLYMPHNSELFSKDELRIARHFAADTLPGLMCRGLIKKYTRHRTGTILQVEGRIWKKRSDFFKESLLTEIAIFNKVNGFSPDTVIVDYKSLKLYARVLSDDEKVIYN